MNKKGVSMITLIITIIVIIILAAIAMVFGTNATGKASVAKFKSEFADFSLLTKREYNKKIEYAALEASSKLTKQQTYYMIASGKSFSEVEGKPTQPAGKVSEMTIEILGEPLLGAEYYELVDDTSITGMKKHKQWGPENEKHYITDDGVAFILPGFLEEEDGIYKWWINERSYYIGEGSEVVVPETPNPDEPETPDPDEPETPDPDEPETPNPDEPEDNVIDVGPGVTYHPVGDRITINGKDYFIVGDIATMEFEKNPTNPDMYLGLNLVQGDVFAYNGVFYFVEQGDWITEDNRGEINDLLAQRKVIKLNLEKGVITPGPGTVEGDIKVINGEAYVYRPYGNDPNGWQYDWWKKINETPLFTFS